MLNPKKKMQRQKLKYLLTVCAGGLIGLMSLVRVAHAETYINEGYLYSNTVWTKAESPYIVEEPIFIPRDISLAVEPGVTIIASSSLGTYSLFDVQGSLVFMGKNNERITVSGQNGLLVSSGGSVGIIYTDLSLQNGLGVYEARAYISSSTITGAVIGLDVRSSNISISNSRFFGNVNGIVVEPSSSELIFPVMNNNSFYGVGGEGNIFLSQNTPTVSSVTITNSAITDNSVSAIKNDDTTLVQASNNWWGSDYGPSLWSGNKITGLVNYEPWLKNNPLTPTVDPKCCSNILFIPGLEGTRLYRDESLPIIGSTTNRLWEPNRNADVKKLYLNNTGSSTDQAIYSGAPIGGALNLFDVYGEFMDYLENFKKDGTINEWKAFGYDWRKSIDDVVLGNEKKATTTESLIQTVTELASQSKTGKVTLIAHSNGGLVAKYLVKTLVDMGNSDLIDSVISVAVPYLGTPEAIVSLLHGDNQSLGGGIILKASTARDLGANMSSAYSLLPSGEYFSRILSPTIAFASTTVFGVNNNTYSKQINTSKEQTDFVGNLNRGRLNATTSSNLALPIKGNEKLLAAAGALHNILDIFEWPTTVGRWAIIGWNKATTKGLEYYEKITCVRSNCTKITAHNATTTIMGDGTVVTPSAAYNSGTAISVNLKDISKQEGRDIAHANILGASTTEAMIKNIITHNPADDKKTVINEISKIQGVTIGEPDYNKLPSFLVLSTHSPVELHVYDSNGNHTGLIPKPAGMNEDVEEGLYTFFEENIIGSKFSKMGDNDNDPEYQIYLPDEGGEKYSVVLNGTGQGEFTFDVDRVRNGSFVDRVEFVNIPVTPLTVATTTVLVAMTTNSVLQPLASTTQLLSIDIDGNGSADVQAKPNVKFGPLVYLESLKKLIGNLLGDVQKGRNIIKRIDKIERLIIDGKFPKAHKVSDKLDKRVDHMKFKKLTDAQKKEIINLIDLYISQFE